MIDGIATKINLDTGVIKTLDVDRFKNVLVLTGAHYSVKVFDEKIRPLIKKANVHIYSGIPTNPTDLNVYNITSFARTKDIDCILSVGGGSVMDCGRLVGLLLSHGGLLHEYLAGGTIGPLGITPNLIYHITVPTVSGTGAEISCKSGFISNKEMKTVYSPYLAPQATYLDPEIMKGIPVSNWAGISFNTFATALAAYVSTYANITSDMFAKEALKGYIEYSPKLAKDVDNVEYIKQMEVASINAFIATNFSSTGAAHAIADVLSAKINIRYGEALALVCGEIHKRSYSENKERYDEVIKMLSKTDKDIKVVIDKLIKKIKMLLPSVKERLEDIGIGKVASECMTYVMRGNPKLFAQKEIESILKSLD